MICETLVQTFVLTAQPRTSAPPRPVNETPNSDSPIARASTSSLILGAVVALLRTAMERLGSRLINRNCRDSYRTRMPKGSPFSPGEAHWAHLDNTTKSSRKRTAAVCGAPAAARGDFE